MPDQGVAMHLHVVGLGKLDLLVGSGKTVGGLLWMNIAPFHGVFRGQEIEFGAGCLLVDGRIRETAKVIS